MVWVTASSQRHEALSDAPGLELVNVERRQDFSSASQHQTLGLRGRAFDRRECEKTSLNFAIDSATDVHAHAL